MLRCRLIERIKQLACLEGKFTLRSGKESLFYIDKFLFESYPDVLQDIAARIIDRTTPQTNVIAGAELGGVPLAVAVSLRLGKPFVIVRNSKKDYGTGNLIEGKKLHKSDRVVIVEDITTTGAQAIETAQAIQNTGAIVEKIVVVVTRTDTALFNIRAADFKAEVLFTLSELFIPI